MAAPQGDFWVRLRPLASDAPAIIRLRKFLKTALRSYRLKCVSAVEVAADVPLIPAVPPADAVNVPEEKLLEK
jgi:hypothetical protein